MCQFCNYATITNCKNSIPGPTGVLTYSDCERHGNVVNCIYKCNETNCNTTCADLGNSYSIGKCVYDLLSKKTSCLCYRY